MRTCCPQCLAGCVDRPQGLVHPDIPELDFAIAAGGEKLALATTLHVHALDPDSVGLVLPLLDHRLLRSVASIEYSNRPVSKTSDEDIASHLVRGE